MLRRLGIRSKVLAVLAVPMIVLLAVVGYVGYGAVQSAQTASAAQTITSAIGTYAPAIKALQAERDASVAKSLFLLTDPTVLADARKKTDAAIGAIPRLSGTDALTFFPHSVLTAFQESDYEHANLAALRAQVDAGGQTSNIQKTFDAAIDADIALAEVVANVVPNRSLAGYLLAFNAIERSNEDFVRERAIGESIIRLNGSSPGTVQLFVTQVSSTELDRTSARAVVANLGQNSIFVPLSFPTPEFTRMRLVLQNGSPSEIAALDKNAWDKGIADQIASMDSVRDKVFADASVIASQASSSARTQAVGTAGIGLLAVGLSLAFALFVSRGIVNPLRRLTAAAADVREQLPKLVEEVAVPGEGPGMELVQIPVESRDEVGRLADAFNSVNATTLQVAQEQAALRGSIAEMFINVARRDQVLLNRQLSFIDSLERTEEDPNALANLFRLDHLATRMRRNAESLLVLAGIDSGRRMRDSMPLSDVIRTASSEIEQYDRIQLDLPIDPHMLGFNALGSAHLLAEILENATVFSEPDTQVEVSTGVRGDNVTVTVIDHGLGMSDEEIALANEKIRSVSASDALGAQRLGLFVVGRLAQRLGAGVEISRGQAGTGTTVEVAFPVVLFQATEAMTAGYGLPSPVVDHSAVPAAPTIEDAAAAWLSPPVIEDVPPVVEPVDLTALTDGATTLGLPKRRVRDGATVAEPDLPPVTQAELRERDESKIVLPALVEPRLAAELAGAVEGWQPDVAAPSSSSLPARSRAASPFWQDVPTEEPAAPAASAPVPPSVRSGLFSGFRRGVDVPPPAPADLAGRQPRGGDEGGSEEHAPGFYAADYHANRYHGAGSDLRDARHDAEMATEPVHAEPEPTPVMPAFVIPGLVPDDEDDEVYVPGRSWDPVPAARDRVAPSAPQDVQQEPTTLPTRRATEPQSAWAPPAAPVASPVPAPGHEVEEQRAWAPDAAPTTAPRWEPLSSPAPSAAPGWPAPSAESAAPAWPAPSAASASPVWSAPPVESAEPVWPAPSAASASPVWSAPPVDPATVREAATGAQQATHANGAVDSTISPAAMAAVDQVGAVEAPWTPQQAWAPGRTHAPEQEWAPEQAWAPTAPASDVAPLARRSGSAPDDAAATATASTFSSAAPLGFEPHLDEARAWSAGEHLDPLSHPAPREAAPPAPYREESVEPTAAAPLPSRVATPPVPNVDASTPWTPAPAPTGFPTFAPAQQASAQQAPTVPFSAEPSIIDPGPMPAQAPAPAALPAPSPTFAEALTAQPATPQPSTLPAWQQRDVPTGSAPVFGELVGQPATPVDTPKRKWGLFGRKKDSHATGAPSQSIPSGEPDRARPDLAGPVLARSSMPGPVGPIAEPQAPVRASAFGATSQAHAAPPQPAPAPESTWPSVPRNGSVPTGAPAMFTPPPIAPVYTPQISHEAPTSWSPPVAAGSPDPAVPTTPAFGDMRPVRNGALDDEVAAMLALRSDIQEQALSELSQLSAYRPTTLSNGATGAGSLTRRVPTAIPKSPEIVKPDGDRAVNRDAAQLRSRLSSFQSGTSRGRRAMDAPTGSPAIDASHGETSPARGTQDSVIDDDHDNTPSTPSW